MKLALTVASAAALVLALVGGAGGAATNPMIPLRAGDKVIVYPTAIACTVEPSGASGPVLHCYKAGKGTAPLPGSYEVSIGRSKIEVAQTARSAKSNSVFRQAQPQSQPASLLPVPSRSPTVFALKTGDRPAILAGTNVFCLVPSNPNGLVCGQAASSKLDTTVQGSYAFAITESRLQVTQALDAAGHSKTVYEKDL